MGGKPSLLAADPRARPAGTGRHSPTPTRSVSKPSSDYEQDPRRLSRGEAEDEIDRLRSELRHHDYLYHVEARPQLLDEDYDRLFGRLKALEELHPDLIAPDSPTQRVGAEPQGQLETLPHSAPMLSLDSTQDEAEVRRFDERVRKVVDGPVSYLLEPKLDGASIELVYEHGLLSRAVTRGMAVGGKA